MPFKHSTNQKPVRVNNLTIEIYLKKSQTRTKCHKLSQKWQFRNIFNIPREECELEDHKGNTKTKTHTVSTSRLWGRKWQLVTIGGIQLPETRDAALPGSGCDLRFIF